MVYDREESFVGHVAPPSGTHLDGAPRDARGRDRLRPLRASSSTAAPTPRRPPPSPRTRLCFARRPLPRRRTRLIECTVVYTNNPPCGAMRGFGAVQTCFAAEAQMDRLAAALGIDPVELRLLNALEPGDTLPTGQRDDGLAPGRRGHPPGGRDPGPRSAEQLPRRRDPPPRRRGEHDARRGRRRGVGFAVGFKNVCFSEGFDDSLAARVRAARRGSGRRALRRVRGGAGRRGRHPAGRPAGARDRRTSCSPRIDRRASARRASRPRRA